MDYSDFTADDFIKDESFQDWVINPDGKSRVFWENWLKSNQHRRSEIEKAREILLMVRFHPPAMPDARVEALWKKIELHTETAKQPARAPRQEPVQSRRVFMKWYQAAAVFIGVLLAGALLFPFRERKDALVTVSTAFGEIKKITLPDRSVVVLNGNSTLAYRKQWVDGDEREVNLSGEAFFTVTHTPNHRKFRVKMNQRIRVDVLGTKFTVTSRPLSKRVVLNEGKVKVAVSPVKAASSADGAQIILKPGEMLQVHEKPDRFDKQIVRDPGIYSAFQQKKIVFNNAPLSEVARTLQDTYGYSVTFSQPDIAAKRFTGSSPTDRVDLILTAIGKAFNVVVIQKGEKVFIKKA